MILQALLRYRKTRQLKTGEEKQQPQNNCDKQHKRYMVFGWDVILDLLASAGCLLAFKSMCNPCANHHQMFGPSSGDSSPPMTNFRAKFVLGVDLSTVGHLHALR